ncbi:MAG: hypothetical protein FWH03_00250 [Firmicutes bacterium]|nr:hypothetical protein [Bacillota bacterium]
MKFSIDKKGYKTSEVEAYLKKLADEYNHVVDAQKERIDELKHALNAAESRMASYKEKTGLITKSIFNAVAKAEEIENLAKLKYEQELARLNAFHDKWVSYYNKLLEKYPLDDELAAQAKFNRQMRKILQGADASAFPPEIEQTYQNEKKRVEERRIGYITVQTPKEDDMAIEEEGDEIFGLGTFDPVERIKNFLHADKAKPQKESNRKKKAAKPAEVSGFSFEEALNPKEDLETIMRELGLLLED